jgi:cell division septal protein FtsQ
LGKRKALKIVSAILLLCALVFVAFEVLHLRKIVVTGCETRSEDEIISLSGLETGVSIFDVDTQSVKDALGSDPYISPVDVSVVYPDCVKITIQERKEAAYIKKDGTLLIIDSEGWLLRILTTADAVQYPEVRGVNMDELTVGKRVCSADTFQLDVLSRVLGQARLSEVGIKSVDLTYAADVVIETDDGFFAEIGDDTQLDQKLKLLKSSIAELKEMGKAGGIIDVASAAEAYYREK